MELILPIVTFLAGTGLGFAGYRYHLKRNPETLEALARGIKRARESAEAKLKEHE